MILLLRNLSSYHSIIAFSQCGFGFSGYSLFHALILLPASSSMRARAMTPFVQHCVPSASHGTWSTQALSTHRTCWNSKWMNLWMNEYVGMVYLGVTEQGRASEVALVVKNLPASARNRRHAGSIRVLGRSPGETHFHAIVWRIPTSRGAWGAAVHGVAKSWTSLKWLSMYTQSR